VVPADAQRRRLTPGGLKKRGGFWWNRYWAEIVDAESGEITRRVRWLKLGKFRTRKAAEEAHRGFLALINPETLEPGPDVSWRENFARFDRVRIALMRPESQRLLRGMNSRYYDGAFGALPLASIDANALRELVASLHTKGLARSTVAAARNHALAILNDARRAGHAAHAIARSAVKLPSQMRAPPEQRHISPAEATQIIEASYGWQRALWALLTFSGMRIGEALALGWKDVDLRARLIRVRQGCVCGALGPLKTARSRRDVPILPELGKELQSFRICGAPNALGLLFASRDGAPLKSNAVRKIFARLLRRLGIPHAGFHAFRHAMPARLDRIGLTPAGIQQWLGHASLSMTQRYLHHGTEALRAQVDRALKARAE
jgi:integrase